ncbi:MAG: hypothetical protein AAF715_13410 [Myxococcota bacterium]
MKKRILGVVAAFATAAVATFAMPSVAEACGGDSPKPEKPSKPNKPQRPSA